MGQDGVAAAVGDEDARRAGRLPRPGDEARRERHDLAETGTGGEADPERS
jgi:hypothetical protein